MRYHDQDETADDAGADDREWPDASDMDASDTDAAEDEDDGGTTDCPYCGQEIADGAQRCPHCGSYISREDAPPDRKPRWVVAGVIVCLLIMLVTWLLGRPG